VLHVSGWFMAEQLSCPGPHTPVHAPLTHVVEALHATAVPYVPFA
jgi:hypothetical protein